MPHNYIYNKLILSKLFFILFFIMAFDPHYSSFCFSNFHVPTINKDEMYLQMQYKESLPFLDDEFMKNYIMSSSSLSSSSSSSSRAYFSEEFGVPGYESFQECDPNGHNFGHQGHPVYYAAEHLMEEEKGFEHQLSGSIGADYKPASIDNWEIQEQRVEKDEEATAKVNRYSVEERREKILKYLKKRNQRNFNKTIKYACRKTLADRRVRVRGRFAKNSEISEDETLALKNNHTPSEVNHNWYHHNYDNGSFQMNLCEEWWLQEAIAGFADNNVSEWTTFENIQE